MRIVFLQDDFPPHSFGGAGFSTFELGRMMKNKGHDVSVITTVRKASEAGVSTYEGLTIYAIATDYAHKWRSYLSLYNRGAVRQVEKILNELQPDIVHINNVHFYLSYHCFKLAKRYAKGVVFTARDTMSICYGKLGTNQYLDNYNYQTTWRDHYRQAGKRWNPFRNMVIKRYLAYADRICAVSISLRDALIAHGITNAEAVHTGALTHDWTATEEEKETFRKKFQLENKKIVLFAGRLSDGKGGRKAIEIEREVAKEVPGSVLLVAGSLDDYAIRMKALAETLGIKDQLIITGWIERDDMRIAYNVADVVFVPSLYLDPFPRVVIEAMAAGKAVVGSRFGGSPEIIVNDKTGYITDPRDIKETAKSIVTLLQNQDKAVTFGRAGRERIEKDFSLEDRAKEYIVIYDSLLK